MHDKNAANGSFGIGGSGTWCNESLGEGGAGYYGGSSGGGLNNNGSAGGGSSYVSGYEGCIAIKSADDITPKVSSYSQIFRSLSSLVCKFYYIYTKAKVVLLVLLLLFSYSVVNVL